MIATPKPQPMTLQEYLEWEEQQPIKYEYVLTQQQIYITDKIECQTHW